MIHLLAPLTLDSRFSAQDLPDELGLTLLNDMVVPRVVSSSMTPTIQEGDRLELGPPTSLTVGVIVVFRNDTLLVCHRITAIDSQGTLSTRGDATQGACESRSARLRDRSGHGSAAWGHSHLPRATAPTCHQPQHNRRNLTSRVRTVVVRSVTKSIRVLARLSLIQPMLAILLQWTATVDVLTPAPLQSLPSHSRVASFTLRMFPHMTGLLAASIGRKPTRYVVRLGPWRLAQYDPATELLLLRQSLRDVGLESFVRQCLQ